MSKHPTQTAFRLPPDITEAMRTVKERDGVPQSEQVRRALRDWLEKRGVLPLVRPDARLENADWPKKTRDVDAAGRPVRRARKAARR